MTLEVLISCMHQKDASIIERTNVQSNVIVINQCSLDKKESFIFKNKKNEDCRASLIYTTERGLSRSRNMAIRNATGDICLICDDDEVLEDDYVETILSTFEKYPKVDVFTFIVHSPRKDSYPTKEKRVGYIGAMKRNSWEIAFRRESINKKNISFDIRMGSGTGNGGGEENKFLFDCLKKGLKIRLFPKLIASVSQKDSLWFHGFTNSFFTNLGWTSRRLLGLPLAWCYAFYFAITKYSKYRTDNSFFHTLFYMLKGTLERRNI